jgi:signal transduction histidine kinase
MARKCFMCGCEITGGGILCEKCDKPRKKSAPAINTTSAADAPLYVPPVPSVDAVTPQQAGNSQPVSQPVHMEATAPQIDPFPKAPVVPFPMDSVSPAVTSVVNLLVAAGVASILLGPDRSVKFVSDEARKLFDAPQSELSNLRYLETNFGLRVGDLSVPTSAGLRIANRNYLYTLVPMSGGASGAALVFRPAEAIGDSHASFVTYVRETVLSPLRALRESLTAAARTTQEHFLTDAAAAVDQVLSSLELAPGVEETSSSIRPVPTVTDLVRRVAEQFRAHADLKGIQLQVDVQELEERFTDHHQLSQALFILMENALHYVPSGGQVVIGVRWMEHKGKPLLLFFVMDNGPIVPEELRTAIFEPSFVWSPSSAERTGRGLFKCREFALSHGGSVWVESKTGKACTFFLRVRPDGV